MFAGFGGMCKSRTTMLRANRDETQGVWSLTSPRVQTLLILTMIFVANQACRALPFYLVDFSGNGLADKALNVDLDFGPAQYGVFATLGFSIPFTLASLGVGVLADQVDRLKLNGAAALLWSACTALAIVAGSFNTLLFERGLMGVAQSATNPASLSVIADLFPDARATANSIFGIGIYLGGGIASLGGALDESVGWRSTVLIFSAASALVALLTAFVDDPRQRGQPKGEGGLSAGQAKTPASSSKGGATKVGATSFAQDVLSATREAVTPLPARWLFIAAGFRFCAGFAILVWLPAVIRQRFPGDVEEFATYNAAIKVFAGGASSLAGGIIVDALRRAGYGDRIGTLFCAATTIASAPLWYFVLAPGQSFETCMGFLLVEYLVAEAWLGPAIASLQTCVPEDRRGAAQGVFSSLTTLGNALPALLGAVAVEELPTALQLSVALAYVLSGVSFAFAALSFNSPGSEQK